ncbi:DNA-binding response regulator [Marinilabiliaceae bacterium JC017]|nr:DNA-binding response regulator [Marinilabiliaceae bacterium JC017]
MKIVIVDDEKNIRNGLTDMLNLYCHDVEIMGTCGSVREAVDTITTTKPDLVLLDIRIEGGSGFDVITALGNNMPMVIFITAYEDYAIKAFKYNAIDYLVKPIDPDELEVAIEKASGRLSKEDHSLLLNSLQQALCSQNLPEKLVLKTQESIHVVKIEDIIYCMSDGSYTHIITGDQKIVVSRLIKEYAELLKEHHFIRIHQSYLINMNKIVRYNKEGYVHLENSTSLPVAARRKEQFLNELERYFK